MSQAIGSGGPHDVGGMDILSGSKEENAAAKIDLTDKPNSHWESCIHALLVVLSTKQPPLATTDQLRRCVEGLEPEAYASWGYYDKWSVALTTILLEIGVITQAEMDAELNGDAVNRSEPDVPLYKVGDVVRIRTEDSRLRWRRPHLRCPGYIFGQVARIEEYVGPFHDPFMLAYRCTGVKQHLYRVSMDMHALWNNAGAAASSTEAPAITEDRIQADIYEGWLEPYQPEQGVKKARLEESHGQSSENTHAHSHHHEHDHHHHDDHAHTQSAAEQGSETHKHAHKHDHSQEHSHEHEHEHGHTHQDRYEVECVAADREAEEVNRPGKVVGEALLRLLYRKGVVTPAEIHRTVEALETAGTSLKAADLVVYAWKDPAFKERLVTDGTQIFFARTYCVRTAPGAC
jgi:nitrile hydratase